MSPPSFGLRSKCLAELVGTYILVLLGCGVVHASVLTGAQSGLWQVAVVWGLAIMLATYVAGGVSGAHINPAMTVALAATARFSWRHVPPYVGAQLAGAIVAAATLFVLFHPFLGSKETEKQVVRGQPGSELTAMCYGEYFPSPGPLAGAPGVYSAESHDHLNALVSEPAAFVAEVLGTLILALVVFAVTDERNAAGPGARLAPVFIGLTVSALISVIAPLTQACFNPARDFGPRVFAFFAGWDAIAIPGPRGTGFLTVYIVAPFVGALLGAQLYDRALRAPAKTTNQDRELEERPLSTKQQLQGVLMSIAPTRFVLVGGFLGAGKTTLLQQAATRLAARGHRVALLVNDQAADLVDTAVLLETGAEVDEVSGGCFCCRFDDMIAAIDRLKLKARPDFIVAEPVGSCTDLSATVLQPLKQMYGRQVELAPYSVLIDVKQVRALMRLKERYQAPSGGFPDDVLYIYRTQVEEADAIVLNKADLVAPADLEDLRLQLAAQFPDTPIVAISALSGEGVDRWLDLVCEGRPAGRKIAAVDYDTYAAGEAALGWMNAAATLRADAAVDWISLARQLLESVQAAVQRAGGQIGHLKLFLTGRGRGHVAGNVTSNDGPAALRGSLAQDARQVALLLNARVRIHAEQLRDIAEASLQAVAARHGVEAEISNMRSFFPSRPVPTHRFAAPL